MTTLLHGALLTDERGETPDGWLLFDGDTIVSAGVGPDLPDTDEAIDLAGARLTPGFIDLHGHGGGGHAYDDGGEGLNSRLRFVPSKTGAFQVVATSFAGGAGTYVLKVRVDGAGKP